MRLFCLLPMFFVTAVAANTAAVTPPSFADLAKRPAVSELKLSPNGRLLAATIPVDNARLRVGVIDLDTMQVKSSMQLRSTEETFSSFMWVGDKYLVLSLARRFDGLADASPTGELATLNVETGRLTYAFGYRGDMQTGSRIEKAGNEMAAAFPIAPVPGGKLATVQVQRFEPGATPGVRTLEVATGRNKRVTQAPVANPSFVADNAGEVRIATGGATVDEHRVHVRDAGGKWRVLESRADTGRYLSPVRFAADNIHFYALATQRKGPDALLRVNINDGSESEIFRGTVADPRALVSNFEDTDVVAIVTAEGKQRLHWLQPQSPEAQLVKAMEKQMPDHVVYPVSASEDGQRVLLLAFSDRNAGDYYLFDRKTRKAERVMSRRSWLPIESLAAMEPVSFKARDGLELHGYLTLPQPHVENPPLVVYPHGGPWARDFWGFDSQVQALATRGFAVLQVNFRGSAGYGVDFLNAGFREWGRKMQDDLTDATRWAVESGKVDPERIAIYGNSYGGYAALMGAVREPDLYRCAISYVGVSDLPMMFTRGDMQSGRLTRSHLNEALGNDSEQLKARSPAYQAEKIKAKVLLVHGTRDERVPVKHAERMRDALKAAGNPAEWYVETDEAHGFIKESANEQLYTRVDSFLRGCLN